MDNVSIAMTIIGLLIAIIGFLVKDKLKALEKKDEAHEQRLVSIENELKSIRLNYLDRFESVKAHITEKFDELKDIVNSIKVTIAKGE